MGTSFLVTNTGFLVTNTGFLATSATTTTTPSQASTSTTTTSPVSTSTTTTSPVSTSTTTTTTSKEPSPGGFNWWIVVVSVLAVVCIGGAGVGGYFYVQHAKALVPVVQASVREA